MLPALDSFVSYLVALLILWLLHETAGFKRALAIFLMRFGVGGLGAFFLFHELFGRPLFDDVWLGLILKVLIAVLLVGMLAFQKRHFGRL